MQLSRLLVLAAAVLAFVPVVGFGEAMADGKALIQEKKCNTCHSVKNVGIEKAKKKKGPDLSGVGLEHDSAWIQKWLSKEVDKKSLYAEKKVKHKKKFKGTPAELKEVSDYLAAQKTKVDVKDEGGEEADDEGGDE